MKALCWLLLTCGVFAAARALHGRKPLPWLSPLVLTPIAIIAAVAASGVSYAAYMRGGEWLVRLLAPTTVAFAVPLHRNFRLLRKHAVELAAGIATGSVVAVLSSLLLSRALGLPQVEAVSMVPRSVPTPFAMAVAQTLGGSPVLAAVF
jgi:putative effector of murein hydrolase